MITEDQIKEKIGRHKIALATLQQRHDAMMKEFTERQQTVQALSTQNQIQFQQLTGAIAELEALLKPAAPVQTANGEPPKKRGRPKLPDRIPTPV